MQTASCLLPELTVPHGPTRAPGPLRPALLATRRQEARPLHRRPGLPLCMVSTQSWPEPRATLTWDRTSQSSPPSSRAEQLVGTITDTLTQGHRQAQTIRFRDHRTVEQYAITASHSPARPWEERTRADRAGLCSPCPSHRRIFQVTLWPAVPLSSLPSV